MSVETLTTSAPVMRRPTSGLLPAVVGAFIAIALAAAAYGLAVWSSPGQRVDQYLLDLSRGVAPVTAIPYTLSIHVVTNPLLWVTAAIAALVLGLSPQLLGHARFTGRTAGTTAALLLFAPVTILITRVLREGVLTRPQLHSWIDEWSNSAPSGHAAAVTACVVVLVVASPPWLRPFVAAGGGTWAAIIEYNLVAAGWHRPSDVVISTLLIVGAGLLLPDPHRDPADRPPHTIAQILVFAGITVAASLAILVYYPRPDQVLVAAMIAMVMAVSLSVYRPMACRLTPSRR